MDRIPPSIPKAVGPFLARAKELSARDPVISYWCKFKAAQLALDKIPADGEGRSFLETLMDDLENSKSALSSNELVTDDAAGSAYVSNFAAKVFERADHVDRDGRATKMTAKEFLAASVFFDILSIFGPLDTDVNEKIKYSKWKAADIARAFKEGRTPTPGPADGVEDSANANNDASFPAIAAGSILSDNAGGNSGFSQGADEEDEDEVRRQLLGGGTGDERHTTVTDDADNVGIPSLPGVPDAFPSSHALSHDDLPSAPPSQPITQQPSAPSLPLPPKPTAKAKAPPSPVHNTVDEDADDSWKAAPSGVDPVSIGNAQKHAKWAISALNYEDIETARKELRLALQLIGG